MPLEATVICFDTSEYMRNGDYMPNRFESQKEAVSMLLERALFDHPENDVGLVRMGENPELVLSLVKDEGKLLAKVATIKIEGEATELVAGLKIAQLTLKHRENKAQRQRIIAFIGSPISCEEKELVSLGKKLKKNNVSVDIVSFGELEQNTRILTAFHAAVNKNESSHIINVPRSGMLLSDYLLTTPLLKMDVGTPSTSTGPAPMSASVEDDPELAEAIRRSLEEETIRKEQALQQQHSSEAEKTPTVEDTIVGMDVDSNSASMTHFSVNLETQQVNYGTFSSVDGSRGGELKGDVDSENNEEDQNSSHRSHGFALNNVIPTSVDYGMNNRNSPSDPYAPAGDGDGESMDVSYGTGYDEDEELRLAIEMSKQDFQGEEAQAMDSSSNGIFDPKIEGDREYIRGVLDELEGVDADDEEVKKALKDLQEKK